jgi:hypothetical protein
MKAKDCPCILNEDGRPRQLCTRHLPDEVKRTMYPGKHFEDDPRLTTYIAGTGLFAFQETSGGNVPAVKQVTEEEYGGGG